MGHQVQSSGLFKDKNVLHFQGHNAEGRIFKAIAGKADYVLARQGEVAGQNPFAKVDIFAWGGNRRRDLPLAISPNPRNSPCKTASARELILSSSSNCHPQLDRHKIPRYS